MNTTESIATEIVATMQALAAEFGTGDEITRSAALEKANSFFCRTFADADGAWAECEAFGDDFQATLERWAERA